MGDLISVDTLLVRSLDLLGGEKCLLCGEYLLLEVDARDVVGGGGETDLEVLSTQ